VQRPDAVPVEVRLAALADRRPGDICTLFIPYDFAPELPNRTSGQHWSKRHAATEAAHTAAMWAYREADDPVNDKPCKVDLVVFRQQVCDDDNTWAALKHIRDYLFKGRLAKDDSPKYVRCGSIRFVTGDRWKPSRAWIVLIIRPLPES
jgi:hypothetical protein